MKIDLQDIDQAVLDFVKNEIVNCYKNPAVIWGDNTKAESLIKSKGKKTQLPLCNLFRSEGFNDLVKNPSFVYNLNCRFLHQIDANKITEIFMDLKKQAIKNVELEDIQLFYTDCENLSIGSRLVVVKVLLCIRLCKGL